MLKRQSFSVVALFYAAMFLTAGCATQNVVKTDESGATAPLAKPAGQPRSDAAPARPAAVTPVPQIAPAVQTPPAAQQAQDPAAVSQLQSALEKIYFDFDAADLSESARAALTKNAALLKKESSARILIEGNCDERGSAEYNLALGERRANAARQYLVTLGVRPERLSTVSYGKEKPAVQGSDESAWKKNRRDEFVVVAP